MSKVKEKIAKFREYLDYIERHYDNVQRAWVLINEKCKGKGFRFLDDDFAWGSIEAAIRMHDESKLSQFELCQYRRKWFPVIGEPQDDEEYLSAWKMHLLMNEHHWQNWTKRFSNHPYGDIWLVDMLCDWIAMGFESGNDNAKEYYEKNKDSIHLPEWAIKLMYQIFDCIYQV